MNLYKNLLFLHGYLLDDDAGAADLVQSQPAPDARTTLTRRDADPLPRSQTMNLFKSMLYLGGLESITSRIGEEEEAFGPSYGNRIASARTFGKPTAGKPAAGTDGRRLVPVAPRNAALPADLHCVTGGCG